LTYEVDEIVSGLIRSRALKKKEKEKRSKVGFDLRAFPSILRRPAFHQAFRQGLQVVCLLLP
jgi:hypothetical protein